MERPPARPQVEVVLIISLPMPLFASWKPLTGCHVLVADDDPDTREFYRLTLGRAGAEPTLVADGASAVQAWRDAEGSGRRFDAAVLDLVMPHMRGTELSATLRANGFAGAILGISAAASPEEVELWLAAGCDEVLEKAQSRRDVVASLVTACVRRWVSLGRTGSTFER